MERIAISELWVMDRPTNEQTNLAKRAEIDDIIEKLQSTNEILAPIIGHNIPIALTLNQFETVAHGILESKNDFDIDPFSPQIPKKENFVISQGGLTAQHLQKFDLEQLLIKEQLEALKHMHLAIAGKEQRPLSPEVIQIISDFIPRGTPIDELPIRHIGPGNYYQQNIVFDMDIAKATMIKELTRQANNIQIKPENIETCIGHQPPQIRLLQVKYPVSMETFQIPTQLLKDEQHPLYNYWRVIKDANDDKHLQKERLQSKAHFVNIKINVIPAMNVSEEERIKIEKKPTSQERIAAAHRIFITKLTKLINLQEIETSPDFMLAFMIEMNTAHSTKLIFRKSVPMDHTVFLVNDADYEISSDDSWESWNDDEHEDHNHYYNNRLRMAVAAPGIQRKFHFQTMMDSTDVLDYKETLTALQIKLEQINLQLEEQAMQQIIIENKYGESTINKLENDITNLKSVLRVSTSELLQTKLHQMQQELQQIKRERPQKLQQATQLRANATKIKKKIAEQIKLYCGNTFTPVFQEPIQLQSHEKHQNGMVNMTIIIAVNSKLNRLSGRRISIQANSVERLFMMNYRQGVIKYEGDSQHHHSTETMKKLINYTERKYRIKKEMQLFSRIKAEKKDEFVEKYIEGQIDLQYGVVDILQISNCLDNKYQQQIPYNHATATTVTNKLKYINHDTYDQIMIIDKQMKIVYITDENKEIAEAITTTMNAIPDEIQQQQQRLNDVDVDVDDEEEEEEEEMDVELKDIERQEEHAFIVKIDQSIDEVRNIQPTFEMQQLINITWNDQQNNEIEKRWKTIIMNKEQSRLLRRQHQISIPYKSLICTIESKEINDCLSEIEKSKEGALNINFIGNKAKKKSTTI